MYGPIGIAFGILWLAWAISWIAAARWASKAAQRPPLREETVYRVMTVVGGALMIIQFLPPVLPTLFWRGPLTLSVVLWVIACGGLGFTWWARIHLGTLWSGRVTRKEGHRIIDTGPYRIVRHPIYTGILIALYAGLPVDAGPVNVLGVGVLTGAFVIKARLEERFLMQELGADAYEGYRRRVPMLVPFLPARG